MNTNEIKSLIRRRRSQMLIHSCLYYEMDDSIVSDHEWQMWADELEKLQSEHKDCCAIGFFDFEFRDWSGATGNHLPLRDPWVSGKAKQVLGLHQKYKNGELKQSDEVVIKAKEEDDNSIFRFMS